MINCAGICIKIEVKSNEKPWRALFAGDARGEALVKWIKNKSENQNGTENSGNMNEWKPFHFVDVPHHGSKKNWDENLFGDSDKSKIRLVEDNCVIGLSSAGGKMYGHPHLKVSKALKDYKVKTTFESFKKKRKGDPVETRSFENTIEFSIKDNWKLACANLSTWKFQAGKWVKINGDFLSKFSWPPRFFIQSSIMPIFPELEIILSNGIAR